MDTGIVRRSIRSAGFLLMALTAPLGAQAVRADSASRRADTASAPDRQLFHRSDLYVAGAFAAGTIALFPLDRHLAAVVRDEDLVSSTTVRNISTVARFFGGPGPLIIGPSMYLVGRLAHVPRMTELAVHGTEAVVVGASAAAVIKAAVGRARPYVSADTNPRNFKFGGGLSNDDRTSFPSGHATAAFSAAAAVVAETHEWWPHSTWYVAPVMYGGATVVGLSRMYDDRHWASDVVMGAAIGTFAGLKTVRFNHTHAGNKLDQVLLGARLVPAANGTMVAWSGSF